MVGIERYVPLHEPRHRGTLARHALRVSEHAECDASGVTPSVSPLSSPSRLIYRYVRCCMPLCCGGGHHNEAQQ